MKKYSIGLALLCFMGAILTPSGVAGEPNTSQGGAQTQAPDANLKRCTTTVEQMLEKRLQATGTVDRFLHFG